jgi:hypothetical protein
MFIPKNLKKLWQPPWNNPWLGYPTNQILEHGFIGNVKTY